VGERSRPRRHRRTVGRGLVFACALALLAASATPSDSEEAATRLVDISVWRSDSGATVFHLLADAPLAQDRLRRQRLDGTQPREVLQLVGIAEPFRVTRETIADANVAQVRIGHHPELDPPELHLVFDLSSDEVEVVRLERAGPRILIELARPPRSVQTAITEPRPTPLPQPTAAPALPPPEPAVPEVSTPEPAPVAAGTAVLTRIEATAGDDGSTLVSVATDRPLPQYSVRELFIAGDPPRHVLAIEGIDAGSVPGVVRVADDNLVRIRVIPLPARQPAEVRVILDLASTSVEVGEVTSSDDGVTVRLTSRPGPADPDAGQSTAAAPAR
jgi:hypothetical protein